MKELTPDLLQEFSRSYAQKRRGTDPSYNAL